MDIKQIKNDMDFGLNVGQQRTGLIDENINKLREECQFIIKQQLPKLRYIIRNKTAIINECNAQIAAQNNAPFYQNIISSYALYTDIETVYNDHTNRANRAKIAKIAQLYYND